VSGFSLHLAGLDYLEIRPINKFVATLIVIVKSLHSSVKSDR